MTITITRSGGFAGLTRVWTVQVDTRPDADEWHQLIERLPWQGDDAATGEADRYIYRVRCNERQTTIPETKLVGPWRELLDRVRDADDTGARRESQKRADAGD
ncbi:protealysin inhibitor emfourin [Homoserinimonas aerilata]|nr:protealysin inhibitor emfourin [Homoserinimonas aerilata]